MGRIATFGFAVFLCTAPAVLTISGPLAVSASGELQTQHSADIRHLATSGPGGMSPVWSGYAITGATGTFTSLTGQWKVPSVSASKKPAYSSTWIGIGGDIDPELIQIGTEQNAGPGGASYFAWWQIVGDPSSYPSGSQTRLFNVSPGDFIEAGIAESGGGWSLDVTDVTNGQVSGIPPNPSMVR